MAEPEQQSRVRVGNPLTGVMEVVTHLEIELEKLRKRVERLERGLIGEKEERNG